MALIQCSECGEEISSKATACIHCGNPIKPLPTETFEPVRVATQGTDVVTVQATGQGPKVVQLIGVLIIVLGVMSCMSDGSVVGSGYFSLLGLLVYAGGRFAGWWRHG